MFKSLRLRLTLFFVLSAGIIYIGLALAGGYVLQSGLDRSLNQELVASANELDSIVDMSNLEPELERLRHNRKQKRSSFMPTIQFFDKQKKQLGYSGSLKDLPFFPISGREAIKDQELASQHLRVLTRAVKEKSEAGFVQVSIDLQQRDLAIGSYYKTCALLSPLLLFGLATAGYLFSCRATRPVEQSFSILRNFVADAGHELNTPLAIMQANVEALQEDSSELERTLPVILRTSERMANLVGDLLLLAQLESPENKNKKPKVAINLSEMCQSLYEDFIKLYEAKGIALSSSSPESLIVQGDRDEIHRAITNLLKNALNYTEKGTVSLQVSKSRSSNQAEISISDTGKGIPAESLERIFDRFYRVDRHRSRAAGGSGLGLAIVKVIAEKHGGSINVKSKAGEGSTFTIELPLSG